MPTPTKPFVVLTSEKKSHRTKAELKARKEGEEALKSNEKIKPKKEVKKNKIAHKEFKRIVSLLENIDKADALYENVINRYALLYAECYEFEEKREEFFEKLEEAESDLDLEDECSSKKEYYSIINSLEKNIIDLDKQIQNKRRLMFDIEKENIMTIASQLRSIPKKTDKNESDLLKVLRGEA